MSNIEPDDNTHEIEITEEIINELKTVKTKVV